MVQLIVVGIGKLFAQILGVRIRLRVLVVRVFVGVMLGGNPVREIIKTLVRVIPPLAAVVILKAIAIGYQRVAALPPLPLPELLLLLPLPGIGTNMAGLLPGFMKIKTMMESIPVEWMEICLRTF